MKVLRQHGLGCESLSSEKGSLNILENGNQGCAEDMGSQGVRMDGKTPNGQTQYKTGQGEGLGWLPSSIIQKKLEIATFTLA